MQWWPSKQRRRNGISRKIVNSLGGKYSTTMQSGTVWLCWRSWRLKSNIRWTLVHLRKPKICANKLDVQETDFSLTQFNRSWDYLLLTQVYAWMEFSLLIFGTWWLKYFIPQTKLTKPEILQSYKETCCRAQRSTCEVKFQPSTSISIWLMLITFQQTCNLLVPVLWNMSLKTMKPWLRWKSKAGVLQWDTSQEPTELLWIGCLIRLTQILKFRSGTSTPNITSQTFWPKAISHVTNGTIFLHLFNISHFSSTCCAKDSSLISCTKMMAKRMQEQKEEERMVAKSKPTAMNMSSTVSASSSSAKDPIASKSPGILRVSGKPDARERRNAKPDAASSSQGSLKDAYLGGLMDRVARKPAATDKNQESWEWMPVKHSFHTFHLILRENQRFFTKIVRLLLNVCETQQFNTCFLI